MEASYKQIIFITKAQKAHVIGQTPYLTAPNTVLGAERQVKLTETSISGSTMEHPITYLITFYNIIMDGTILPA